MDDNNMDQYDVNRNGMSNKEFGKRGENAAARYLSLKGLEILDRNWVCPAGEADIVACDGDYIVFVEVKTRSSLDKGFPCESVTADKRHKYELIAGWYLRDHDIPESPVRFDVVDLLVVKPDRALVRHIVNAFGASS